MHRNPMQTCCLHLHGDDDAGDDQCQADDFAEGDGFLEEQRAKEEDGDEGEAHEGIGEGDVEFGHGGHPEEAGEEGGGKAGEDERVEEGFGQEQQLAGQVFRESAFQRQAPFQHQLAVDGEEDTTENVDVAHCEVESGQCTVDGSGH